uniref:Uncharacterized protein n=1 Tax=Oryza glaberrima TaxID=4538 RepID=I1QTR1_ORYGL
MELELKLCQCQTGLQIGRDRSNEQADGRLWPTRIVCDSPCHTMEIMGTPYPHGMVIQLVIGDNLYLWNMYGS